MANPARRGKIGSRSLNRLLGATSGASAKNDAVLTEDLGGVRRMTFRLNAKAIALVDEPGVVAYGSVKFAELPQGDYNILSAVANLSLTKSSAGVNADFDGDFGVGTTAAGNNAALATTEQNIIPTTATPQAAAGATTAKGRLAAPLVLDSTGGVASLYLNFLVDDADHNVAGTPCNLVVTGTITVVLVSAGDI